MCSANPDVKNPTVISNPPSVATPRCVKRSTSQFNIRPEKRKERHLRQDDLRVRKVCS